eukprot:Lankesteria_metandrocarpae@DN9793_c0_g1_i1.p1
MSVMQRPTNKYPLSSDSEFDLDSSSSADVGFDPADSRDGGNQNQYYCGGTTGNDTIVYSDGIVVNPEFIPRAVDSRGGAHATMRHDSPLQRHSQNTTQSAVVGDGGEYYCRDSDDDDEEESVITPAGDTSSGSETSRYSIETTITIIDSSQNAPSDEYGNHDDGSSSNDSSVVSAVDAVEAVEMHGWYTRDKQTMPVL